jgi:hypothetical protein
VGESLDDLRQQHFDLETQFRAEIEKLAAALRPESLGLEPLPLRPKKTDITVEKVVLAWLPYVSGPEGKLEAAF